MTEKELQDLKRKVNTIENQRIVFVDYQDPATMVECLERLHKNKFGWLLGVLDTNETEDLPKALAMAVIDGSEK